MRQSIWKVVKRKEETMEILLCYDAEWSFYICVHEVIVRLGSLILNYSPIKFSCLDVSINS